MSSPLTARTIVAGCAAATAVTIGIGAHAGAFADVNRLVRRHVHPRRSPRVVKVAKAASYLAMPTLHPFVAIAGSVAVSAVTKRPAPATFISSIAAILLDRGARFIIHEKRPPKARKRHGRQRFAYPSGHTAATAGITLAMAIDLGAGRPAAERALLYSAASLCTALVGWSRLELDEHWIDDVAGGWALGVATAIAATSLVDRLEPR